MISHRLLKASYLERRKVGSVGDVGHAPLPMMTVRSQSWDFMGKTARESRAKPLRALREPEIELSSPAPGPWAQDSEPFVEAGAGLGGAAGMRTTTYGAALPTWAELWASTVFLFILVLKVR